MEFVNKTNSFWIDIKVSQKAQHFEKKEHCVLSVWMASSKELE